MTKEQILRKLDALLREYSPLIAGHKDCIMLRWELNELFNPENGWADTYFEDLTVRDGRVVLSVSHGSGDDEEAEEWCAAFQDYVGHRIDIAPSWTLRALCKAHAAVRAEAHAAVCAELDRHVVRPLIAAQFAEIEHHILASELLADRLRPDDVRARLEAAPPSTSMRT